MRKYQIVGILLIVGGAMVVSAILADFLGESPEDMGKRGTPEHSMIRSGLPPQARRILVTSTSVFLLCPAVLLFYIEKLDGSLTSEKHVVRLKRLCRIYKYSLTIVSAMLAGQVFLALAGLSRVNHIMFDHLLHSAALINLGAFLVSISMLLYYREYLKAVRRAPASVILESKRKMIDLKQEYDLLPKKLKKEEIASLPLGWIRWASDYPLFRDRAISEYKPGFYTLLSMLLIALVKHDKHLIDVAIRLTKDNVQRHEYLLFAGPVLCDLGFQGEGLAMLREALELDPSTSSVTMLAGYTQDIDEKERLANKVLSEDPEDYSALGDLADAKYHRDEIEEAGLILNRILELNPESSYALEFKGNICFDREEYQEALAFYRKIKAGTLPVSLQFKICRCYYSLGMVKKAKRIARKIENHIESAYEIDIEGGIEAAHSLLTEILNS